MVLAVATLTRSLSALSLKVRGIEEDDINAAEEILAQMKQILLNDVLGDAR